MNLLTPAEHLIYDTIVGPIYDLRARPLEGDSAVVEGRGEAIRNILSTLGPIADVLLELWPMIKTFELDGWNPDLYDKIQALPDILRQTLDLASQEATTSE